VLETRFGHKKLATTGDDNLIQTSFFNRYNSQNSLHQSQP